MSKEKAIDFYKTIKEAFPNDLYKHKELTRAISAFYPDFYKLAEGVKVSTPIQKSAPPQNGGIVMTMAQLYDQTNQKKTNLVTSKPSPPVAEKEVVPPVVSDEPSLGVIVRKLKGVEYTFDLDELKRKDLEGWIEYFKAGADYEQMLAFSISIKMKTLRAKNSGAAGIDLVNDLFTGFQEKYLNPNAN